MINCPSCYGNPVGQCPNCGEIMEEQVDFTVNFKEVTELPKKLDFSNPGPHARTVMHAWLNRGKWFEITPKEGEEYLFQKKRASLASSGVTIVQRTHSDKSKHYYACWELKVSPAEYNRAEYYMKKKWRDSRPKHD